MKVIVLGAGLVGGPMAADLSKEKKYNVTIADKNNEALKQFAAVGINTLQADLADKEGLKKILNDFDLVISAMPGFMGFETLKTIIESKKNVVDIAFFPEDPFLLNDLAIKNGVTAIVDCGVAPGMSNILTAFAEDQMDEVDTAITYVGGLPQMREWPYEYKAVFSPVDVIEEYVRPARFIENGKEVIYPALSGIELINIPGLGTLESFNTDGVRSLAKTIKAKNIREKTLRYPGYAEKMLLLRETGFFNNEEIEIKGVKIRPVDFTAKLLFPKWKLNKGDEDLTVMQVSVKGLKNGKPIEYVYDLLDKYDPETGVHSMARTTGYTATGALGLLAENLFSQKGVIVPEYIGRKKECVDFLLNHLKKRNIHYSCKIN